MVFPLKLKEHFSVVVSTVCLVVLSQAVQSEYTQDHQDGYPDFSAADENDFNRTLGDLIRLFPGYNCTEEPSWPYGVKQIFPCSTIPPSITVPTSVHKLRPGDINVIGAIGDSLSAANGGGACSLPQVLLQYRGKSFSHGGDESFETVPTLANILRKYNPSLLGYGKDTGGWFSDNAGMNVAVPGSLAEDMEEQVRNMVQKMKEDGSIDFARTWKLVTLFVGGNDLCEVCRNKTRYSAEAYVNNIKKALQFLHDEMPRTLVNVIGMLDLRQINTFPGFVCKASHLGFCPCVGSRSENYLETEWVPIYRDYQKQLEGMVTSGIFDDKDDFTAVYQPFLHDSKVFLDDGSGDITFMAPDCFHFSAKGHAESGKALWNNMVQPVGSKVTEWVPGGSFSCPTEESPYLFTNVNSRQGATADPAETTTRALAASGDPSTEGPGGGAAPAPLASSALVLLLAIVSAVCHR